jgi:hypothetical protein
MCTGKIASAKQTNVYQTIASALQRVKQPVGHEKADQKDKGGNVA